MIRILIAEDSTVVALLLRAIFDDEPDMAVIGHARDGREAVEMAQRLRPDLITMDIRMPVMDGFEATREVMAVQPIPIVVVSSSVDDEELRTTFRALQEGALAVIEKPRGLGHPDFQVIRQQLVGTVRAMAEVKVVRRRRRAGFASAPVPAAATATAPEPVARCDVIALAASTGGPQALREVIGGLDEGLTVPVVVVQHIGQGFLQGMVDWLNAQVALDVRLVGAYEELRPATVYFAPEDRHLAVTRAGTRLLAVLDDGPPQCGVRPSANPLFASLARSCPGRAVGVVLSGMGSDGSDGLLAMRQGGCHTLAQDADSCVVYGMPGAAVAVGAVEETVRLDAIAARLMHLAGRRTEGAA